MNQVVTTAASFAGVVVVLGCVDVAFGTRILPAIWEWTQQAAN